MFSESLLLHRPPSSPSTLHRPPPSIALHRPPPTIALRPPSPSALHRSPPPAPSFSPRRKESENKPLGVVLFKTISHQPHPLENSWTFWFDNFSAKSKQTAWGSSIQPIYTFSTVEEFWSIYNNIHHPSKFATGSDFYCFKHKIEPKWEDPICSNRGNWTMIFPKGKSDTSLLYTVNTAGLQEHIPVQYPEVVLSVEIYHNVRKGVKTQELLVLGGQSLAALRDNIYCSMDQVLQKAGQHDPSGYFLVEVCTITPRRRQRRNGNIL